MKDDTRVRRWKVLVVLEDQIQLRTLQLGATPDKDCGKNCRAEGQLVVQRLEDRRRSMLSEKVVEIVLVGCSVVYSCCETPVHEVPRWWVVARRRADVEDIVLLGPRPGRRGAESVISGAGELSGAVTAFVSETPGWCIAARLQV